jgi:uncharacterized membrane protein (DUF2068 family)
LDDGTRLSRCLRCDAWIHHEAPTGSGDYESVPPPAELPRPKRGKVLEDRILLRVIAVERAIHSVIFGLFALGLVLARHDQRWLVQQAAELKDNTSRDASLNWLTDHLDSVIDLRSSTITMLMVVAALYCVSEGVEAVGLWRGRRWAEYLTALATAGFLPLEIRLLTEDVTVLRLIALAVNLAILVYLIGAKRLFGLRGGRTALDRARAASVDWDDIVANPPTASD